jgi:hypothetical protein
LKSYQVQDTGTSAGQPAVYLAVTHPARLCCNQVLAAGAVGDPVEGLVRFRLDNLDKLMPGVEAYLMRIQHHLQQLEEGAAVAAGVCCCCW